MISYTGVETINRTLSVGEWSTQIRFKYVWHPFKKIPTTCEWRLTNASPMSGKLFWQWFTVLQYTLNEIMISQNDFLKLIFAKLDEIILFITTKNSGIFIECKWNFHVSADHMISAYFKFKSRNVF